MIPYFIFVNFLSSVSMGVFLIALPWLIVDTHGGDALIAISVLAMLTLFLIRKRSGALVDAVSRGRMFATAMLLMASLLTVLTFRPDCIVLLLGVFFCGQIYLYFYYVVRSAIAHEIVPEGEFGRYNGILEIESQVSTFVAGGVTAYFFVQDYVSLSRAFGCAAAGMCISALIVIARLRTNVLGQAKAKDVETASRQGYSSTLLLLSYCGSVPFICVMLLNIVKPIVIVDLLSLSGEVLALTSIYYTTGAIAAGVLGSQKWIETAKAQVIFVTLAGFLTFCILPAIISTAIVLYISSIVWGLSNGLSRITWQTAAMNQIGNEGIGKFFASITAGIGVVRIALLLGYWAATTLWGFEISFVYLAVICFVGLAVFVTAHQWTKSG